MTTTVNMLWLGAAKRVSLYEQFQLAANQLGIRIRGYSIESTAQVPLGMHCEIVIGPKFTSDEFVDHLCAVIEAREIDLVIPFMDAATVALSACADRVRQAGAIPLVSSFDLCEAMEDKIQSDEWFAARGVARPEGSTFPQIAKHRKGFGARDQSILRNQQERDLFFAHHSPEDYIVQPFINGPEYTVDAYVDRSGVFRGALSRQRLQVVGGEVEVSRARYRPGILQETERVLSFPGWCGPITLQFIEPPDGNPVIIEINPRFGGGAPHSIHAGLPLPHWVLAETLGRPMIPCPELNYGSFMTRYRKEVFYDFGG